MSVDLVSCHFGSNSQGSQAPCWIFSHPPKLGIKGESVFLVPWLSRYNELILPLHLKVSWLYIIVLERTTYPIIIGKRAEHAMPFKKYTKERKNIHLILFRISKFVLYICLLLLIPKFFLNFLAFFFNIFFSYHNFIL